MFCDLREIEYKFSAIVKNVKPENLLYKINKQINTNDTSTLDFTFGGTNNNALEPVSTRFYDNIVKNDKTLLDYVNKQNANKE